MKQWQKLTATALLAATVNASNPGTATAQARPEGEMRFAVYVTIAPS